MTRTKAHRLVRWFARCGDRYVEAYLSHVDSRRLAVDKHYGLKLYFFMWAFERAGAPRAYKIAAVKAVSSLKSCQTLRALFKEFCGGKRNEKANPALDPNIDRIDIPHIVQLVGRGELGEAVQNLKLRGVGPKLGAFFLRDVVTLLKAEAMLGTNHEAYVLCQPIDVWLRFAAKELCGSRHRGADLAAARGIVQLSIEAGVSPLRVNQGIWYFSANAVADQKRLRALIRSGDDRKLQAELALMQGFLPVRPMWG